MMTERPIGALVQGFAPPKAPAFDQLSGRYVTLERLDPARHAEDLFHANLGHDWLWDYLPYGPFDQLEVYRDWQAKAAAQSDPVFYALRDNASGMVGGIASFMRIDAANGVIEIGNIQISPLLQRSPATTEAISLMIGWAFAEGYRRVEWKCDALNAPSVSAAGRYGFTYEGTFRQHMMRRGHNRDTAWFAILDGEWASLGAAHTAWLSPANFAADGSQKQRLSDLTAQAVGHID